MHSPRPGGGLDGAAGHHRSARPSGLATRRGRPAVRAPRIPAGLRAAGGQGHRYVCVTSAIRSHSAAEIKNLLWPGIQASCQLCADAPYLGRAEDAVCVAWAETGPVALAAQTLPRIAAREDEPVDPSPSRAATQAAQNVHSVPADQQVLQETEPSRTAAMSALAKSWTDYAT